MSLGSLLDDKYLKPEFRALYGSSRKGMGFWRFYLLGTANCETVFVVDSESRRVRPIFEITLFRDMEPKDLREFQFNFGYAGRRSAIGILLARRMLSRYLYGVPSCGSEEVRKCIANLGSELGSEGPRRSEVLKVLPWGLTLQTRLIQPQGRRVICGLGTSCPIRTSCDRIPGPDSSTLQGYYIN